MATTSSDIKKFSHLSRRVWKLSLVFMLKSRNREAPKETK